MAETTRRIYFFRLVTERDTSGKHVPFDTEQVLGEIEKLDFINGPDGPDGRYVQVKDAVLCCWPDRLTAPQRVRIGRIRRNAFPQLERGGRISPLDIPEGYGLAEQTHFVFLPHNIIGWEYNFYGPRVGSVRTYLNKRGGPKMPPFSLEPLFRQDVLERLDALGDIRLLQLSARASYSQSLAKANRDLAAAFDSAANVSKAMEVALVLKPETRKTLSSKLLGIVRKLALREETKTDVNSFIVKGLSEETGRVEEVDLLNDHLIAKKAMVLEDETTRAVNSASAYRAIEEAYEDIKVDLLDAIGIKS